MSDAQHSVHSVLAALVGRLAPAGRASRPERGASGPSAALRRGSAPRFRRHLASFGAITAMAFPVRPAGYAHR
jgi:hypothetical protein